MPVLAASLPARSVAPPRVPSTPLVGGTTLVTATGRCCTAPVNSRPRLARPIEMAEASPLRDPLAITTLDDSPGVLDVSFRLPVPTLPSSAEFDASNAAESPAAAMALYVAVTRAAIVAHGAPARVSRNGVVPSTEPPIT